MKIFRALLLMLTFAIFSGNILGQESTDTVSIWLIETFDDNEFVGNLLFQDDKVVRIRTTMLGELTIPRQNIKKMSLIESSSMIDGEFWFDNPHSTRYFYGPNGYGLKSQEGYYQNTWVLFNQVSVGLSDHLSFGVGLMPLFLFGGAPTPVWITPKVSFPVVKDKINIGGGVLAGSIIGETGIFGVGYSVVTFGNRDNNATFGMGLGFSAEDGLSNLPTFLFSGMKRVGKRGYLITENYFIQIFGENLFLASFGGRTVRKNIAIDFGLILPVGQDIGFIGIPWLGVTIPFGDTGTN